MSDEPAGTTGGGPEKPKGKPEERALRALHGRVKPQPKVDPGATKPHPTQDMGPLSGASGFVGMLAKGQVGSEESRVVSGKPVEQAKRRAKYKLPMAREITEAAGGVKGPGEAEAPVKPREEDVQTTEIGLRGKPAPGWYGPMIPVLLVLSGVLVVIGLWAVGALAYMHTTMPLAESDVKYPLIQWRLEAGDTGGFTEGSWMMAWGMVLCLPVSAGLVVVSFMARMRVMRGGR